MSEIPDFTKDFQGAGEIDDSLSLLDPDATLAQALVDASTGYKPEKVRGLAFLAIYAPSLYRRVSTLANKYQLNMSPGATSNIRKAIEARAMREMQTLMRQSGGKGGSQ